MAKKSAVIRREELEKVWPDRESILDKIDCHSCLGAKLSRRTVPLRTTPRAIEVDQKQHIDVCGPFDESLRKSRYIVLFKDEFSNYRVAYCIRKKDEVFEAIQKAFVQIKADTNESVGVFSNCGPEMINNKLRDFLIANDAVSETSAPNHPSQNCIIGRDNGTMLDSIRAMLFERKIPPYLWLETAQTAVYILNLTSNTLTEDRTPIELCSGRKPSLKHIKIFGCLAFIIQQEKLRKGYKKKLNFRGVPCILVGHERDYC